MQLFGGTYAVWNECIQALNCRLETRQLSSSLCFILFPRQFRTFPSQDEVLIAGFGRRGHAVGDIPGVRFKASASILL
jgi:ribosomal protein S12